MGTVDGHTAPGQPDRPDRRDEIGSTLRLLHYPASSEEQPGWFLQESRPVPGHVRRPAGTFVIFWLYLHTVNPLLRPLCDREGGDLALLCLAMDLRLLGFDARAQGINYRHGGLVSVVVAP